MPTIYVALLDEGVDVWRPVDGELVGPNLYRVAGPVPEGERWQFAPGEIVHSKPMNRSGDFGKTPTCLVASEKRRENE